MANYTVSAAFDEGDGSASSGQVRFVRRQYIFTATGILVPAEYIATLDGSGEIAKVLRGVTAGDDPATWDYLVFVEIDGQDQQKGPLTLTANVDLADVMAGWDDPA